MAEIKDTLSQLSKELAQAFAPIQDLMASDATFQQFAGGLGWNVSTVPLPLANLVTLVNALVNDIQIIESASTNTSSYVQLINDLKSLLAAIEGLSGTLNGITGVPIDFANKFPAQLVDSLIINYLLASHPTLGFWLETIGIIRFSAVAATNDGPAFTKTEIAWSEFSSLLSGPSQAISNAFAWAGSEFDSLSLLCTIRDFLYEVGLIPYMTDFDNKIAAPVENNVVIPGNPVRRALRAPIFSLPNFNGAAIEFGVEALGLPQNGAALPGLAIMPYAIGNVNETITLTENLSISIQSALDLQGGIAIRITPDSGFNVLTGFANSSAGEVLTGSILVKILYEDADADPLILLGTDDGSNLQVTSVSGQAGLTLDGATSQPPEIFVEADLQGGKVLIIPDPDDGFLSDVLPANGIEIDFQLSVGWSRNKGFYFKGAAGLEVTVPVNISILDAIAIDSAYFALTATAQTGIQAVAAVDASVSIGPISATIDKIGIVATANFPGSGGNLGPANLTLGFKSPDGVGVELDATIITGGGYLFYDSNKKQYGGTLSLSIEDLFTVTAIGLITTQNPDGTKGFSMLVVISVEFVPIQLGFGFTLNGVGGLAGVNRVVSNDALTNAFQNNSINNFMFPQDPINNAPAIISSIASYFPQQDGRYIFAPMLKIDWGEGIVTSEFCVLLSLPEPIEVVVIGYAYINLPDPDNSIISINLEVLGLIDLGQNLFSLSAKMYNSHIAFFQISGDMEMRLIWGDNPSFALAIGGFNPHFQPPPNFPTMQRITFSYTAGSDFSLMFQSYMAVTSNSYQIGALTQLYAGAGGFNVTGHIGFDALIIFSPFSFTCDFSAGVSLNAGGTQIASVQLSALLSGPSPWHVKGDASISILFFSISVGFDKTFGDATQISLPANDPTPLFLTALNNPSNWNSILPVGGFNAVSIAMPVVALGPPVVVPPPNATTFAAIFADPGGGVAVRQKVLPLSQTITMFGSSANSGPGEFSISDIKVAGTDIQKGTPTLDYFAPAQFQSMTDDQKLSAPSFQDWQSGAKIGDLAIGCGPSQPLDIVYNTIIWDSQVNPTFSSQDYPLPAAHQIGLLGTAPKSRFWNLGSKKFASENSTQPALVELQNVTYVITSTEDLSLRIDILATPTDKVAALNCLNQYLVNHPNENGTVQVMSLLEVG